MKPLSISARLLLIFFLVSLLNLSCENDSETVINENVSIIGQSELNSFTNNNYQIINGNLEISSTDDDPVISLSGLSNLQEVNGGITVKFTEITSLQGIENVRKVTSININNNQNLENFSDFQSLEEGLQRISIHDNQSLTSIDINLPFSNLTSILINNNPQLSSIVEGDQIMSIEGELEITDNPNLQNINGFNSLTTVNGIVSISDNDGLQQLSMPQLTYANRFNLRSSSLESANFINLETVNFTFDLWHTQLENFEGFSSLNSLGGRFTIIQNNNLTDWCAMSPLILNSDFNFGVQYFITTNGFNPSQQDWENGDCSL